MDVLAQELIDSIVEEIVGEATLQTFSLVARLFVEPCQRRLFRELQFFNFGRAGDTQGLVQRAYLLFHTSPHLRSHVRTLAFDGVETLRDPGLAALTSIIRILHNITHLILVRVKWNDGFPNFIDAISASILRPSLQSLTMLLCNPVPANLLTQATTLRHLILHQVVVENHDTKSSLEPIPFSSSLTGLYIADGIIPTNVLPCLVALKHLTLLSTQISPPDFADTLTALCPDGLEHLTIGMSVRSQIPTTLLARLEFLRSIELRFVLVAEITPSALLAAVPDPVRVPQLETLTLFVVDPQFITTDADLDVDLDARLQSWCHLRAFKIHVRAAKSVSADTQDHPLFAYIQAQLPRARERGLLFFSNDVLRGLEGM
ncbi:hypothetical protein C8R43DRAFT_351284 [Mycena crocata]|nr:hypothetical protein C8R43DRAFT_351284 [Mycena crocata]